MVNRSRRDTQHVVVTCKRERSMLRRELGTLVPSILWSYVEPGSR